MGRVVKRRRRNDFSVRIEIFDEGLNTIFKMKNERLDRAMSEFEEFVRRKLL